MRRFGSKPAKKSGQNVPKNRCRATIAEPIGKTLAELPFIGNQVFCLSHDQVGGWDLTPLLGRPKPSVVRPNAVDCRGFRHGRLEG